MVSHVFMTIAALALAVAAFALPNPQPLPLVPDPSGNKNIGNVQGLQFITGACTSNADCASQCCARLNGGGICSGPAVANAQGKQGCGFDGSAAVTAASPAVSPPSLPSPQVNSATAGSQNVGTGKGQQFITGQCLSDADCASGCCAGSQAGSSGACSAKAVANEGGKTGCGFVQN